MLSSIVWDVDPAILNYPTVDVRKCWLIIGIVLAIILNWYIGRLIKKINIKKPRGEVIEVKWFYRLVLAIFFVFIFAILFSLIWGIGPVAFTTPGEVRWYGVLWAIGFWGAVYYTESLFCKEKLPNEWLEELFFYSFLGILCGARLGHCLFYQWDYYSSNLLGILKVWEGGLASHGGVFGVILALWLYSRKITKQSVWWLFDRLIPSVAVLCFCIRFGNLMNSEIFGFPTDMPWGFEFVRSREWHQLYEGQACHPTQIYEMLYCLTAGVVSLLMYHKFHLQKYVGLITGVSLLIFFGTRLLLEFMKNPQVAQEVGMTLNIGQLLSLPLILLGCYLIWNSRVAREKNVKYK